MFSGLHVYLSIYNVLTTTFQSARDFAHVLGVNISRLCGWNCQTYQNVNVTARFVPHIHHNFMVCQFTNPYQDFQTFLTVWLGHWGTQEKWMRWGWFRKIELYQWNYFPLGPKTKYLTVRLTIWRVLQLRLLIGEPINACIMNKHTNKGSIILHQAGRAVKSHNC